MSIVVNHLVFRELGVGQISFQPIPFSVSFKFVPVNADRYISFQIQVFIVSSVVDIGFVELPRFGGQFSVRVFGLIDVYIFVIDWRQAVRTSTTC